MLLSKCAVSDCKRSKLIKQQEASGLLSSLGLKITLSKTPLVTRSSFTLEILTTKYKK